MTAAQRPAGPGPVAVLVGAPASGQGKTTVAAALARIHAYGRVMAAAFERIDVLLSPVMAEPPAEIGRFAHRTEDYLSYVLSRITLPGALYLGLIALIPLIALVLVNANQNFPFGGTSILIMVGVALDTVKQIESQLQQRNYEGFLR